jgi:hypothetical protein
MEERRIDIEQYSYDNGIKEISFVEMRENRQNEQAD